MAAPPASRPCTVVEYMAVSDIMRDFSVMTLFPWNSCSHSDPACLHDNGAVCCRKLKFLCEAACSINAADGVCLCE